MRSSERHHFKRLLIAADQEVRRVVRALPRTVREKARALPVIYEPRPPPEWRKDGIDPDILGLFVGESFRDAYAGAHDLPAQVFLFLENIWEYAHGDAELFREEVRRTYLHELGHYLGLDEDELADRELD